MPAKSSPAFWAQAARGLFSPVPTVVTRKESAGMKQLALDLLAQKSFDRVVCDFLTPAINLPPSCPFVLFQHNVETLIWRRYAERAADPLRRAYYRLQAARLFEFERRACQRAAHVATVSENDARLLREWFGISGATSIPTGVNADYFQPPADTAQQPTADLVFVGSFDWTPNIEGISWFVREVLPLIRQRRPGCSLALVGRDPVPAIRALAEADPLITVTGTVPDVRPWLWGGGISIVPLRIGGGTRLKIYESMAAAIPVVSTTIGAEGLEIDPPNNIRVADTAAGFASECLSLLENARERDCVARAAVQMVRQHFSWENAAQSLEGILATAGVLQV
jgi:glycosyltransferase involved in cell wall biosynthesis